MAIKHLPKLAVLVAAFVVAGCNLTNPATEAPTQTAYPTYTPYPTFTPLPTATATFLPSPTPVPTLTTTPTIDSGATPTSASGASGLQAVLLYDSNLRAGPGTSFDSLDMLNGGEPITILGRDLNGGWLYVRTTSGQEGWVRVTQIQGPLDIPRIPLAQDIPTPSVTETPRTTGTPGAAGTPGTGTPSGPTPTAVPANSAVVIEITAGDPPVCQTVNWTMPNRFQVDNITAPIVPFDSANPQNVSGRDAFRMFRTFVPEFIDVKIQGNLTPGGCNESDHTCLTVTFELCASAPSSAPTGGSEYRQNITLQVGTQSYNQMYVDAEDRKSTRLNSSHQLIS